MRTAACSRRSRRRSASRRLRRPRRARAARAGSAAPRVVLAVAVEADGDLVAVLERVLEAGLDGAADAEVERQPDDRRARGGGDLGGRVGRAVVDDDDVEPRIEAAQLPDDRTDRPLLVAGRDDREPTRSDTAPPGRPARPARAAAAPGARTCARRARARGRARPSPRPRRVVEQLAVGGERLVGVVTTSSSCPGSNQRSMPSYGFETIAARRRRARTGGPRRTRTRSRASAA